MRRRISVVLVTLVASGAAVTTSTLYAHAGQAPDIAVAVPDVASLAIAPVSVTAPKPTVAGISAQLKAALANPALGTQVNAVVLDALSAQVLYEANAGEALPPASTAKIATAVTALGVLGPNATLKTKVVAASRPTQGPLPVTLVGGGDVLLAAGPGRADAVNGRAGLTDLATATAQVLRERGITTVSVHLDDTVFSGPTVSPHWEPSDVKNGFVAPVTALAVDSGAAGGGSRPAGGRPFARVSDPALAAASSFVAALTQAGISVTGAAVREPVPVEAETLAQVESAPLTEVVSYTLTESDNTVAESLARLVARATNRPATFAGAGAAVVNQLAYWGIPTSGAVMAGGSGLGSGYSLAPMTIALSLTVAAHDPQLRTALTGMPVAGATGTLVDRFTGTASNAKGVVRAKTGTLSGVNSLAGVVVDADGRVLVFVILATGAKTDQARVALDQSVAALARCGCR